MLLQMDLNQAHTGKALRKGAWAMCRVPEKSRWNTWHLWLDGGQFLIINRSFIEEKFEEEKRGEGS